MKKLTLLNLMAIFTFSQVQAQENSEWTSLFDGKTMNDWHQYNGEGVGPEWSVTDGL